MMAHKYKRKKIFPVLILLPLLLFIVFEISIIFFKFNIPFIKPPLIPTAVALEIKESCGEESNQERCYADSFYELIKEHKIEDVLTTLDELNKIAPQSRGCHLISHYISIGETEKNPSRWEEVLGKIDVTRCTGGFLHGVIEVYARNEGGLKIDGDLIHKICGLINNKLQSPGEQNCAHIMGHLALSQELGDVEKGADICATIDPKLQYECYSGVFMENETRENLIIHANFKPLIWDARTTKIQEDICREYDDVASVACWREISHMFAIIHANDPTKVYEDCLRAPSGDAFRECYFHAVSIITVAGVNPSKYEDICQPFIDNGNDFDFRACVGNSIGGLITSSPEFVGLAIDICEVYEDERKDFCYRQIGISSSSYNNPNIRNTVCAKVPRNYQALCLNS